MLRNNFFLSMVATMILLFAGLSCAKNSLVPMAPMAQIQENDEASDSVEENDFRNSSDREPASMTGNVEWLNEVQDDFSRIAAETSNRSLASRKTITLVQKPRWVFQQDPNTNQFVLKLNGKTYSMLLANPGEENNFSLAAEGQTESPITLNISSERIRSVAQENKNYVRDEAQRVCSAELNFWDAQTKRHQKDFSIVRAGACNALIEKLRSFVP